MYIRKSKQAIDKAFEIDPDLPDAHLALGLYYYRGYLKYPEALKQFELVLKVQPKNSEAIYWSALFIVVQETGRWQSLSLRKPSNLTPEDSIC